MGWIFIPIDEFYSKADIAVDDDKGEVYRDSSVEQWIEKILNYYTLKNNDYSSSASPPTAFLEAAAESVLRIPFYQLLTDFTATYAAESLGHRQFARLVLTPLSGLYPVEYKILVLENFVRALVNFKISKASTPFSYWRKRTN
ncbi:8743_t:CDS:2 [Paraglomus brasilianum]|uniref:8743_t:CDS:1 n=1 Tax=Paraglomus brasilianum TaxID=144538 RepID=A0A9N9FCL6_9GLOM|nr:8743_t:CDS:2 [Paraglomus brasilianum]